MTYVYMPEYSLDGRGEHVEFQILETSNRIISSLLFNLNSNELLQAYMRTGTYSCKILCTGIVAIQLPTNTNYFMSMQYYWTKVSL